MTYANKSFNDMSFNSLFQNLVRLFVLYLYKPSYFLLRLPLYLKIPGYRFTKGLMQNLNLRTQLKHQ